MDRLTPEQRSFVMSRIRGVDTGPEMQVRRALHALGYRFRLHGRVDRRLWPTGRLPGKPDLVFAGRRKVIHINGCFWHRHARCGRAARLPSSNRRFWRDKFERNRRRGIRDRSRLHRAGWRYRTVWECDLARDPEGQIARLVAFLEDDPAG